MAGKRQKLLADSFRARVRQMIAAGMAVSAIAKATGKSVTHVKQIAEQERHSMPVEGQRNG